MMYDTEPYRRAEIYDIAFSFRDLQKECDFLEWVFREHGCGFTTFLELACGPGLHVLEMARRGRRSAGLDCQPEMLELLRRTADAQGLGVTPVEADMRDFEIDARIDGAAILMDSSAHLLGTTAMLDHLRSMAGCLVPGGVYVLEMSHPSNHFGVAKTSGNHWTAERDGLKVTTTWGHPGDPFDSLTQIDEVTVVREVVHPDGRTERFEDRTRGFRWTKPHFEAVVALSEAFDIVCWFGSLDRDVPLDLSKEAWRMVPVLRRR